MRCREKTARATSPGRRILLRQAQRAYLVELVAYVENAHAFGGESSQCLKETRHRLRREDGGGLVHDHETRRWQQATYYLDTLPLTARAKALMMVQSAISLLTIALVAARAVNILS